MKLNPLKEQPTITSGDITVIRTSGIEGKNKQPVTAPAASAEESKKLIAQLGDSDVKVRDAASKKLFEVGNSVLPALNDKLKEKGLDPEISGRIRNLIEEIDTDGVFARKLNDTILKNVPLQGVQFSDAIEFLRTRTDMNFNPHWAALSAAGIGKDKELTISLVNVSVKKCLDSILSDVSGGTTANLGWAIDDSVIEISTKEDLEKTAKFRIFLNEDAKVQQDTPENRKAREELGKILKTVPLAGVQFSDAIQYLRDKSDLNIDPRWPALAAAGIGKDKQLTVSLVNVSFKKCLESILNDVSGGTTANLGCIIKDGVIVISTKEDLMPLLKVPATGPAPTPATAPAANTEEIKKLIAQLGDSDFKVRDAATEKLVKIGEPALPVLKDASEKNKSDPEIAARLEVIIKKIPTAGNAGGDCSFYGIDCKATDVVFVMDRSGSMIQTFDYLRKEMLDSIGKLKEAQNFHVIFYAMGRPLENPPKQLVAADKQNKAAAAEFLKGVTPEGQTDPVPALARAFDVLKGSKNPNKVIYLLSDGLFPDNNAVQKLIADRNPAGENQIAIHTILYGERPKEAEEFMRKIAADNKGRYKFVNPDGD
ncbi:MAG: VWA domain-containing protein [Planctomycetes bacterium]|nr:VWA domain-containing protein [Planctomycetota bacterium]